MGIKATKFDKSKLVPRFTVEIKLMQIEAVHPKLYSKILSHPENYFGVNRQTLWKLRFTPYDKDWSPLFMTMVKIADYFGCTVDSLYNRTQQKLLPGEQLEIPKTEKKNRGLTVSPVAL